MDITSPHTARTVLENAWRASGDARRAGTQGRTKRACLSGHAKRGENGVRWGCGAGKEGRRWRCMRGRRDVSGVGAGIQGPPGWGRGPMEWSLFHKTARRGGDGKGGQQRRDRIWTASVVEENLCPRLHAVGRGSSHQPGHHRRAPVMQPAPRSAASNRATTAAAVSLPQATSAAAATWAASACVASRSLRAAIRSGRLVLFWGGFGVGVAQLQLGGGPQGVDLC